MAGAWDVHRHVEEKPENQVAQDGVCNIVWVPDSQAM